MSELVVRISADIKKLQDGYSEAAKETQALNDRLVSIAKVSGIGFAATVAAIGLTVAAYREQEVQENKIKALIEATGGAVGYTSKELVKMAEGLQSVTLYGDEVVMEGQAMLLTFTKIGKEVFPKATEAALNMATVLNVDVAGASKILGKALNDPIEGISALSRAGVQFSEEQKKVIEALVRTGDIAKAQEMILGELEKRIGGTARAAAEGGGQFTQLKNVFGDIMEEIGSNFIPLLVNGAKSLKDFLIVVKDNQYIIKLASLVLGVGAALTGLTFAAATGGAALVSIRAGMIALEASMVTGRVAAIAFWGAATLGISLLIVSMPEIIAQFTEFKKVLNGENKPEGLIQIGNELKRLYDLKEKINNQTDINFGDKKDEQVKKVQDQIDALEALRKKTQEIEDAKSPKEPEKPKDPTDNFDEQTKKRLMAAKNEVDLLKLQQQEASKEEVDFAKQKQELLAREELAGQEKVTEIRNANLEAVRLEKEELLLSEEEYYRSRAEIIGLAREEQAILDEEMKTINEESKAAMRDGDLEAIRSQILTENEAARELGKEQLTDKIALNNQKMKDQVKYGKAYAEINAFMHTEEVKGVEAAANQMVQLTQSKNSTLKGIGKAAALTQIAISTAQGAIGAYASLAPIPFVGPALGIIAATSLSLFGLERASAVMAAADGGLITGGQAGRDSVPAMLMPGEIVVPTKNYEEVIGAVRTQRSGEQEGQGLAGILIEIRETLKGLSSGITINGDFLADDIFIDRMVSKINDGVDNRNLQLRTT